VGAALERWRQLRARAEALRPVLQREDQLMQEILDHGLRGEDRRTLRRLASGSSQEAEEVAARYVAAAIGSEMQALKETLVRNRKELLQLSATTLPDKKRDLVVGLDEVRSEIQGALDITRSELLAAKERGDVGMLRSMGRSFNDLKVLLQRLEGDRRKLTKNSALAALLVTVCRRVLPVRQIDPSELRDIPPSHEGFLRIADFHLFSDSGLYDFGEHCSGPNLFTRLKRNVAILHIRNAQGEVVYNTFAVSGELNTPGAPPVPDCCPLRSIEAEDEHGRLFDRHFDAEFKLLGGLCAAIELSCVSEQAEAAPITEVPSEASAAQRESSPPRKVPRLGDSTFSAPRPLDNARPQDSAQSDSRPLDCSQPDTRKHYSAQSESRPLDCSQPDTRPLENTRPTDSAQSDSRPMDCSQPDARPPDSAQSDLKSLDCSKPDTTPQDSAQSDSRPLDCVQPDTRPPGSSLLASVDAGGTIDPMSSPSPLPELPEPLPAELQVPRPSSAAAAAFACSGRLWSRKPLCRSCAGAVSQIRKRFPTLHLEVAVGDSDEVWTLPLPKEAVVTKK